MNETKTFDTLEEYAKHIGDTLMKVIVRIESHPQRAEGMLESLINEAYGIVQAQKMKQEVEAGFDLSILPKPEDFSPTEDVENPSYRE